MNDSKREFSSEDLGKMTKEELWEYFEEKKPISLDELRKNPRRIYAYLFYPNVIRSVVDKLVEFGNVEIPLAETLLHESLWLRCDLTINGRHYFIV